MIKDVSKQWASLLEAEEENEKIYGKACQEACQKAKDAEKKAIMEYDVEEVMPDDIGIDNENINEIVDPLQMWNDIKKKDGNSNVKQTVKVDNNYINAMKRILSSIKSTKPDVYKKVIEKLEEYKSTGIELPLPEDYAENFIPYDQMHKKLDKPNSEDYSDTDSPFGNKDGDDNLWNEDEQDKKQQVEIAKDIFLKSQKEVTDDSTSQQAVKDFLNKNKEKIQNVKAKTQSEYINKGIDKIVKYLKDYADGKLEDNELNEAKWQKGKHPLKIFVKGCMHFLLWILALASYPFKWTGWLLNKTGEWNDKLCTFVDKKINEGDILECDGNPLDEEVTCKECGIEETEDPQLNQKLTYDNQMKFISYMKRKYKIDGFSFDYIDGYDEDTSKDIKGLISDGSITWKQGLEILKDHFNIFLEADYREKASHLLDPVGVKASTASLKGQDTAEISIVEKLYEKIKTLEEKIDNLKNSSDPTQCKSKLNEANDVAEDFKNIQKWYAHLMRAYTSVPDNPELIGQMVKTLKKLEMNWQNELGHLHGWEQFSQVFNTSIPAEEIANQFQQSGNQIGLVVLQNSALPFQFIGQVSSEVKYKDMIQKFLNQTQECRKYLVSKQKDVENISKKLKEGELEGKDIELNEGAIGGTLGSIGGALGGAAGGAMIGGLIPGMNGAGAGIGALAGGIAGGLYGKEKGEKLGDKTKNYLKSKIKEDDNKNDNENDNLLLGDDFFKEADTFGSLSDEQLKVLDRLSDMLKSTTNPTDKKDIERAKTLQEISYERNLTKEELDEFKNICNRNPDISDALIVLSKTGFARPGNHTGIFVNDEHGNRVEVSPFPYTEDPEDHSQRKSIEKRQAKINAQNSKKQSLDNANSNFENSVLNNDDINMQDWSTILGSMKTKEKKEFMKTLIDDIEDFYAGKDDIESKKAREDEIQYIWKIFNYDPGTRDFGQLWKVSHRGAGKKYNRTLKMMANAFKHAGITKMSDLSNLSSQKFNQILKELKDRPGQRRSWKIDKDDSKNKEISQND